MGGSLLGCMGGGITALSVVLSGVRQHVLGNAFGVEFGGTMRYLWIGLGMDPRGTHSCH